MYLCTFLEMNILHLGRSEASAGPRQSPKWWVSRIIATCHDISILILKVWRDMPRETYSLAWAAGYWHIASKVNTSHKYLPRAFTVDIYRVMNANVMMWVFVTG